MTGPRTTAHPTPGAECRCPSGYPITAFRDGRPVREHHLNMCGLPNEDASSTPTEEPDDR